MHSQKYSRQLVSFVATRAEVYGLFLAALLIGGSATAFAAPGDATSSPVESSTPVSTQVQPEALVEPEVLAFDSDGIPTNDVPISDEQLADNSSYDVAPSYGVGKDMAPYIGENSQTLFAEGENHVCGWDTSATSGWSYILPSDPCYAQYREYVSLHCESNDGVVSDYICEGWFQDQLQSLIG